MTTPPTTAVRRLAFARAISLTGGAASFAALNFAIYQRTHSATWVAATLFLTFGTVGFVGLFAGALGDRFDRKRVMIVSDLAGAVCFGAMAFVHEPVWLLVVAFLSALAESPFLAASAAAIPNLVDEDRVAWANGLLGVGRNVGILIGPLIGGVLVGTHRRGGGVRPELGVVRPVRGRSPGRCTGTSRASATSTANTPASRPGVRFIARDRVLRSIALAWVAIAGGLGMTMVADVPLVNYFGAGGVGYGVLIACWGGGSIVGSLLGSLHGSANRTDGVRGRLRRDRGDRHPRRASRRGSSACWWRCSSWGSATALRSCRSRASCSAERPTRSAAGSRLRSKR